MPVFDRRVLHCCGLGQGTGTCLRFQQLPDRTSEIRLNILADKDDSDLAINRRVAAIDLLAHMGTRAKSALALLIDLPPLVESDQDIERWLALRAASAVWKITGESEPAVEVASQLAEDENAWLRIHAAELLGEISG